MVETTLWFLVSEALSNAIKHARRDRVRVEMARTARRSWPRSPTTAPAAPAARAARGCRASRARVEALGGRCDVESPPGAGTTLTATIPLAPWRTATEPFLEFGHDGDGGNGRRKIEELLAGTRSTGVSLAREWEFEGGPPRIGQRLPVYDHTGRGYGLVEVVRVAVMPFGEIDASMVDPEPGESDWHAARMRAYDSCRDEIAALLGEPDWRLTDAEPMVILTYRSVPAAPISGSIL